MNQRKIEKLQAELMLIGLQLLTDHGHKINSGTARHVELWARNRAADLVRRKIV